MSNPLKPIYVSSNTYELIKELADNNLEFPKQHQGEGNLKNFLEEHQDITKYLFNKFISALKKWSFIIYTVKLQAKTSLII